MYPVSTAASLPPRGGRYPRRIPPQCRCRSTRCSAIQTTSQKYLSFSPLRATQINHRPSVSC
ncbi:uncharacterized protein LACBIDRAFT_309617 [Laccaria bicolor S238N-H82]|uniref:Predicted protein n=1 Tax=Laccaria bicolor (strain S238N-H82 / ATCC MYA-4686) TaxID=486041 RepID=B0DSP1_LACBS|nr:uncharacterized protein LACBIDRAFT_309617 [Laccaria bicolor S238N-H82]EDR02267.1 predicted protein [Laccaria bicolor S238N-H82]|eukprot:XP_001886944.1 predicted protein [Laccaria bicolor S238N-H82]